MTLFAPDAAAQRLFDRAKWNVYESDVLPMWVADTDFLAPQPVIDALKARADHGLFGYQMGSTELKDVLVERLQARHKITATPEQIIFTPGLVFALFLVARMIGEAGDGVLMTMPMYPPFMMGADFAKRELIGVELASTCENGVLRYEMDFDALEAAITPRTRLWMFCNPHNPVGRAYTRAELERVAEICLSHDLIIVSDEIHSDLVFDGHEHVAIAGLSSEIAARTITLNAPSKAFNLPGLDLGYAVITNPDLLEQFQNMMMSVGVMMINSFGYAGAVAAYTQGQAWLEEMMRYLADNRAAFAQFMRDHLPQINTTIPDATYLAWLDCRALALPEGESPHEFFLKQAKVGLNDGKTFGAGGDGFVRLNFGCSRETLSAALERMREAVAGKA
jgi:cystathionine beta-lyase